jgi:hypothetical protein
MPPRWSERRGIRWINPEPWVRVRSMTLSDESSVVERHHHEITLEAMQSWGSAVRYLIVRLADAAPCALLVWLAYVRR